MSNSPSTQTHLYFSGTIHAPNKNNNSGCIYVYAVTMKDFLFSADWDDVQQYITIPKL